MKSKDLLNLKKERKNIYYVKNVLPNLNHLKEFHDVILK